MDASSSTKINTAGGTAIAGSVDIKEGDFISRDKIINVIVLIPPPTSGRTIADLQSNLHLLNFTRPLTLAQRKQIEESVGQPIGTMIEVKVEFAVERAFAPQCVTLLDKLELTHAQWQTLPIVVNLPGLAPGVACLLAELHGRIGHFPSIVRLAPQSTNSVHEFTVAEIINLQAVRNAVGERYKRQSAS